MCVHHISADETVSGKLTVDQNASATALEVKGGSFGYALAEFIRDNGTGSAAARIRLDASANNPEIIFTDYSSTGTWALGLKNAGDSFRINQHGSLDDETNTYFTINNDGKVGIGTTSPSSKLSIIPGLSSSVSLAGRNVQYGVTVSPTSGRMGYAVVGTNSYLGQSNDSSAFGFYHPFDASNANAGYKVFRIATGLESGADNTSAPTMSDRFYIRKDGGAYFESNVGIGTSTPGNKLEVNGTIRSKEVIVETTGWPDFVFEDGYDLPTLDEVELHIEEKGHLPGVASAEEINSNGQSLGETQRLMMQKIEELTLYVLELKSENTQLNERVQKLESK